jgi:uncharacterized protein YjbI with pentapeptide repeats
MGAAHASASYPVALHQETPGTDPTITALQKEQLRQQVEQLDHTWENWLWANAAPVLSAVLSTLILVGGGLIGFLRWRGDLRLDREKRSEERFQAVIRDLSHADPSTKVGAAIMLRTFLQPGYAPFARQVFDLVAAHLRLTRPAEIRRSEALQLFSQALTTTLRDAFPQAFAQIPHQHSPVPAHLLDASGIHLEQANLAGADLTQAWMPGSFFSEANLESVTWSLANLERANLTRAHLQRATLIQTNLRQADLTGANCERAELGEAILDGALLIRATFTKANLAQASLIGANLTEAHMEKTDLTGALLDGAHLVKAHLANARLSKASFIGTDFLGADLSEADLTEATFTSANPATARALMGTKMQGVIGLTQEQRDACTAKGALW